MDGGSLVLTRSDIRRLLEPTPPIVEGLLDVEEQVQPNGIDLTLKEVASFSSAGSLGYGNETRVLSHSSLLALDKAEGIHLPTGCYLVTYNEIVHLPKNIICLALPRSSLLRCGVSVHTAVWDAGYSGRSQSLLVVYNPNGFRVYRNARIVQLVFLRLEGEVTQGYHGMFQGEGT